MPYPQYTVGCAGLLLKVANGILPEINAMLAKMVTGTHLGDAPTTVSVVMGRLRTLSGPTLSLFHSGEDRPAHDGQRDFTRTIRFKFVFLAPQMGSDLPSNYEMARQVTADVLTCRLDDTDMLTPKINAGAFGSVSSLLAQRGRVDDITEFIMPDGITTAEGFQIPWEAQFSLSRLPQTIG